MYEPKMKLTKEQQAILTGEQGPVMAQVMETIVMFGDMFGAKRLVKVTHNHGHLVTSFGLGLLKPLYAISPSTRARWTSATSPTAFWTSS